MPRKRNLNARRPTIVHKVWEALRLADDFVTAATLSANTGCSRTQVWASLCHLQNHRAADCVTAPGGLWWFATPDTDNRVTVIEERKPEDKPRRARRSTKKENAV